jgi:hypothetical protein
MVGRWSQPPSLACRNFARGLSREHRVSSTEAVLTKDRHLKSVSPGLSRRGTGTPEVGVQADGSLVTR